MSDIDIVKNNINTFISNYTSGPNIISLGDSICDGIHPALNASTSYFPAILDAPVIALKSQLPEAKNNTKNSLIKVNDLKWKIVFLSFENIILLQDRNIQVKFEKEVDADKNETVYMIFNSIQDEIEMIMLFDND